MSEWTIGTLKEFYDMALIERDKRFEQRFHAQEKAVRVALEHANKEFHEHLVQVREETSAALAASEKAIAKAEQATEKDLNALIDRVDLLREQLVQLTNIAMPKPEFERAYSGLIAKLDQQIVNCSEKITAAAVAVDARLLTLQTRIDAIEALTR